MRKRLILSIIVFIGCVVLIVSLFADSWSKARGVLIDSAIDPLPADYVVQLEIEPSLPDTVYTTTYVNIRCGTGTDTEILLTVSPYTPVVRVERDVEEGWDGILVDEVEYYIYNEYITTEVPDLLAPTIEEQLERLEAAAASNISSSDLRYMAAIIYAEAGNQCYAGQQAVGIVVMNRSESSDFANGIYNVISESGQFTPYSNGSFNSALALYDAGEIPDSCIEAAEYALQGYKSIYYNGQTYDLSDYYFFSRYLNNARLVVEDHMFR